MGPGLVVVGSLGPPVLLAFRVVFSLVLFSYQNLVENHAVFVEYGSPGMQWEVL